MTISKVEIRSGAYYDSVILMQLQRALAGLGGVIDAGAVMGTDANKHILEQSDLFPEEGDSAGVDDLLIVVKAENETAASEAIEQVDELLSRRSKSVDQEYLPKSLDTAAEMAPDSYWVLVSVPGRHAAAVARNALDLGKNVFLYSDNVSLEDEIALKEAATEKGLLVMGPDCGTAIVNGVGLGFANQVRRGPIGLVAASGTGLQAVSVRIHQLGSGLTHALGTGGRDLKADVNALTTRQGIDLLNRDPSTEVIVVISKPPAPEVARSIIRQARRMDKPVVVNFIGFAASTHQVENVFYASSFDEAARLAVELASETVEVVSKEIQTDGFVNGQKYLRGLFSGGTLAYETLLILQESLPDVYSNVPLSEEHRLPDSMVSQEHSIVDLGEDEFTVGRLHPMMDNDLRIRRLEQEAEDPEVAMILLDVVLGHGAHPDPASELAPAIKGAIKASRKRKRRLEVVAVVLGTDEDPQDMQLQLEQLKAAGAVTFTVNAEAARYVGRLVNALSSEPEGGDSGTPVELAMLNDPLSALNVGLESFAESLTVQEVPVVHVDWRPPAGGNEQLMSILDRMKSM